MNGLVVTRRLVLGVLWSLGLSWLVLAVLASWSFCTGIGSRLAPELTREGLLKLRPGMTEQEVLDLLGPPLGREKLQAELGAGSWVYGETGLLETGIEIRLRFQGGRMVRAGAEVKDLGVYWCKEEECPVVRDEKALACLP